MVKDQKKEKRTRDLCEYLSYEVKLREEPIRGKKLITSKNTQISREEKNIQVKTLETAQNNPNNSVRTLTKPIVLEYKNIIPDHINFVFSFQTYSVTQIFNIINLIGGKTGSKRYLKHSFNFEFFLKISQKELFFFGKNKNREYGIGILISSKNFEVDIDLNSELENFLLKFQPSDLELLTIQSTSPGSPLLISFERSEINRVNFVLNACIETEYAKKTFKLHFDRICDEEDFQLINEYYLQIKRGLSFDSLNFDIMKLDSFEINGRKFDFLKEVYFFLKSSKKNNLFIIEVLDNPKRIIFSHADNGASMVVQFDEMISRTTTFLLTSVIKNFPLTLIGTREIFMLDFAVPILSKGLNFLRTPKKYKTKDQIKRDLEEEIFSISINKFLTVHRRVEGIDLIYFQAHNVSGEYKEERSVSRHKNLTQSDLIVYQPNKIPQAIMNSLLEERRIKVVVEIFIDSDNKPKMNFKWQDRESFVHET